MCWQGLHGMDSPLHAGRSFMEGTDSLPRAGSAVMVVTLHLVLTGPS